VATTLPDIKRRIGTTTQIRKVTSTLQKVAAAKLVQDLRRISNASVYFQGICRILKIAHGSLPSNAAEHPLMMPQSGDTISLVVFGSDRGLCGAFNTLLMNTVQDFIRAHADKHVQLLCRGKVIYRRALRHKMPAIEMIEDPTGLGDRILADFLSHKVSEVHMLYWHYETGMNQSLISEQILPTPFSTKESAQDSDTSLYDEGLIEPSPDALIETLLPEYVRCSLHNGFYNSAVTEHAQRRASMSRATNNATEMLVDLKKKYSRLRQENITTEMLEIVAGLGR